MKTSFLLFACAAPLLVLACGGSSSSVPDPGTTSTDKNEPTTGSPATATPPAKTEDPNDPKKNDPDPVDPPPAISGPPATPADCDAFAAKFCTKAAACNHLVSKIAGTGCEEAVAGSCKARLPAPGTAWNQTALTGCGNAYATLTCTELFGGLPPKACTFVGTLANNAECAFDDQCASGHCSGSDGNSCGKCAPNTKPPPSTTQTANLGEACDNAGQTAPQCNFQLGLWCDSATKKCADIPVAAVGQACGFTGESLVLCSAGGTCKYGSGGSGTCVAEKAIGAACTAQSNYNECAFGTSCIGGTCAYPTAAAICK